MLVGTNHMKHTKLESLLTSSLQNYFSYLWVKNFPTAVSQMTNACYICSIITTTVQYQRCKLWLSKLSSDSAELMLNWCAIDCFADLMGWFTPTWKFYHNLPTLILFCKTWKIYWRMFLLIWSILGRSIESNTVKLQNRHSN